MNCFVMPLCCENLSWCQLWWWRQLHKQSVLLWFCCCLCITVSWFLAAYCIHCQCSRSTSVITLKTWRLQEHVRLYLMRIRVFLGWSLRSFPISSWIHRDRQAGYELHGRLRSAVTRGGHFCWCFVDGVFVKWRVCHSYCGMMLTNIWKVTSKVRSTMKKLVLPPFVWGFWPFGTSFGRLGHS